MKFKLFIFLFAYLLICLFSAQKAEAANPQSGSFTLLDYGFGAGGVATSSSQNFLFQGTVGELETASPSSQNFIALPGLTYTLQPNIPAPAVTNPSNYYNKLHITIANAGYPTDTTYAIQVSSGSANFSQNVYYVQNSNTLDTVMFFQSYTLWGGSSGFDLIGLYPGTTYYVRAAAKRGTFEQGPWSATANAATINPTFTFNVQTTSQPTPPFSVNIGNLTAGAVSTSSDKVTTTISTNASNGGLIYLYGTNNGLKSSTAGNYTITSGSNDLGSVLTPEGYGARGTTTTQTSGGPMQLDSPYTGSGDNVGVIDTTQRTFSDSSSAPVTNGQASFELKAKASNTTPSATDYTDTVTIIGTGSF